VTTLPAEAPATVQPPRACLATLAGYRFAVEVRFAREVVVLDEYTLVPLAPAHLLGLANLRGNVITLVDVRPLLGMTPAPVSAQIRALVVECDGVQLGLLIDEALGLEPLEEPVDRAGRDGTAAIVAGRLDREGRAVALLDVRGLLVSMRGDGRVSVEVD
jgi:purine-binding chemotaxis protein CheW